MVEVPLVRVARLALIGCVLGCSRAGEPPPQVAPAEDASTAPVAPSAGGEVAQPEAAPAGPETTSDPATAWEPTEQESALVKALSVRDPVPSCAEVEALVQEPVVSLTHVVENVTMPPWAPMRAATCLIVGHPTEARATIVGWMAAPETKGLARLALQHLDTLPVDVAVEVASASLSGPEPDHARARIAEARAPEVRAVALP